MEKITHEEFSALLSKFRPIIKNIVFSYYARCRQYGIDAEDLEQTAAFKLWKLANRRDYRSEDFDKYANTCLINCIYNTVMRHATGIPTGSRLRMGITGYPTANLSLDSLRGVSATEDALLGSTEDDYTVSLVEDFINTLPKSHAKILREKMEGYSFEEIAMRNHISYFQTKYAFMKIRRAYMRYTATERTDMRVDAA